MAALPGISILIPNFNGVDLLRENLPYTLDAAKSAGIEYEILVADDASTDLSCHFIEAHYPEIRLIKGDLNLGFAGNCNRGSEHCLGEWILLLNTDVKLHSDYIRLLLPFAADPAVFGLAGSIWPDGPGPIMDAGKYPIWSGFMLNTTTNFQAALDAGCALPSLFLSGAASLLNAEKFRALGGFQELFNPYYFEDAEICLHAWRRGWSSYYIPEARCFHRISSTIGNSAKKDFVRLIARRNKLLLHEIHLDGFRRILWKLSLMFHQIFAWLSPVSVKGKAFQEYLKRKDRALNIRRNINTVPGVRELNAVVQEIKQSLKGKTRGFF